MTTKKAAFIHSAELEKYSYPPGCPFDISRAGKVRKALRSMGLYSGTNKHEVAPAPADRSVVEQFHTKRYLDALQAAAKGQFDLDSLRMGIGTQETPIFNDMYDYAMLACGASLKGAELILSGQAQLIFNPSGGYHHAQRELAAGFCYINDVAIACMELAKAGKRVLYLDIDAHHGDGVQNAFYHRSDVMTISFHESGKTLFPGTGFENEIGSGEGKYYCVNFPLPEGTNDQAYKKAFKAIALPLIRAYDPDVIVFELGADTLAGDPLAHLQMTNNSYADTIYDLLDFNVPILMTGGGGYSVDNTVRAWALAWSVLTGSETQDASIGLGGVMLESTDWHGGLRDRQLPINHQQHEAIMQSINDSIEKIQTDVFPFYGLHRG